MENIENIEKTAEINKQKTISWKNGFYWGLLIGIVVGSGTILISFI